MRVMTMLAVLTLTLGTAAGCAEPIRLLPRQLIHDGGDRDFTVGLNEQGRLVGVDSQDTAGRFTARDPADEGTAVSNRVAVESPRFGMVTGASRARIVNAGAEVSERSVSTLHHLISALGFRGPMGYMVGRLRYDYTLQEERTHFHTRGLPLTEYVGRDKALVAQRHDTEHSLAAPSQYRTVGSTSGSDFVRKADHGSRIDVGWHASEHIAPMLTTFLGSRRDPARMSAADRLREALVGTVTLSRAEQMVGLWAHTGRGQAIQESWFIKPGLAHALSRPAGARTGVSPRVTAGTLTGPGTVASDQPTWEHGTIVMAETSSSNAPVEQYTGALTPWQAIDSRHLVLLSRNEQFKLLQSHKMVSLFGMPSYPACTVQIDWPENQGYFAGPQGMGGPAHMAQMSNQPAKLGNLLLLKSVDQPRVEVGGTVTFTIVFRNVSTLVLEKVVLVDSLHERLRYVPGSATASVPHTVKTRMNEVGSTLVRWELTEPLKPDQQGQVSFQAKVLGWPEDLRD